MRTVYSNALSFRFIMALLLILLHQLLSQDYDQGKAVGPPDVFFMGCAKAGTTALHDYLTEAANICGGTMKEYHYWEFHHDHKNASLRRYFSEFKDCKPGQLTMDGSPSNSGYNAKENIIHTYAPDNFRTKKFILILREPIDRMYSWYNFERAKSVEQAQGKCNAAVNSNCARFKEDLSHLESFKEYYDNNKYYGVKAGSYLDKLTGILYDKTLSLNDYKNFPLFPRNQIFIINYDTLKTNSTDTLKRITKFLGVEPKHYNMPVTNQLITQLHTFDLEEIPMQCSDYFYYKPIFEDCNEGLLDFINDDPNRPPEEPYFPPFIDNFAELCKDEEDINR